MEGAAAGASLGETAGRTTLPEMKCPRWLYSWVDRRDRIPRWLTWIYPLAHFCPEMDGLLIIDNLEDCFCGADKLKRSGKSLQVEEGC